MLTFGDMQPGDIWAFSVKGEICSPNYITVEHGIAYKITPDGEIDPRPRRIGPELEVTRLDSTDLHAARVMGLVPPALAADARAANDP